MKILKVYRELRDIVIFEKDDGKLGIRAMHEDVGTEEDRELIVKRLFGGEFKPNNVETIRTSAFKEETPEQKDNEPAKEI